MAVEQLTMIKAAKKDLSPPGSQENPNMELPENSGAAMVSLLLSFAYVDGELHPKEVEVIKRTCADLDVDPELVDTVLDDYTLPEGDSISVCTQAMLRITDEDLQNRALIAFRDIAAADNVFEKNEQNFLALASEAWGVQAIEHEDFEWDDQQRPVVEAGMGDRLEVYAGPGMGKTEVACARVSELIQQGVEPTNIWLLSFTRTAVQEIRNRIESFAEDSSSVLGVKIGTIDSRAWRIRCGFSDGEVEKLFGGYDASIRSVIEMVENDPREMREFLESLDHVIIDEAQDITGLRARLVSAMLKLLPEHSGVTIFADPAQAIYGWTTDGEDVPEEDRVNLLGILKEDPAHSFVQRELQTIHRTQVPNLVELMEELRLDIYVNDGINLDAFKRRRGIIVEKANESLDRFDAKELREFDNALVLFRRRSEVLMASSLASSERIRHRIRMSGLPSVVRPWLGCLLADYSAATIDKGTFLQRWDVNDLHLLAADMDYESAWNLIFALGRKGGDVRVSEIRKKLARTPPEITATVPDLGTAGPIIGTIHASKGREADEVVLRLPHDRAQFPKADQLDEESRVMFVGASRAKSRLCVGRGFLRASFAPSLNNGRSFLRTKAKGDSDLPAAQVEIGREGDLDPYSFVSKSFFSQSEVCKYQGRLARLAIHVPVPIDAVWDPSNDFRYQIWTRLAETDPGKHIGYFAKHLNGDFFDIIKRISGYSWQFRPPNRIRHLHICGVSTFAASEDEQRLREVHEPFATTGIWLIPVILGYPKIYFPRKKLRKW